MKLAWLIRKNSTGTATMQGLYHYIISENGYKARVHLRIDPDGFGTLIVNANTIYHLNPTATTIAYLFLEKTPAEQAINILTSQYRVSKKQAREDYSRMVQDIETFINPENCALCNIDTLEVIAPFSARPTAPYRMDLAITYRCNNECHHCYNGRPRSYPELTTEEWVTIIDKLWDLGVPHIIFTGGEPTLRNDLPELIAHAESNGQITGLNTNGRRLSDLNYVKELAQSGLDHVQITLESHNPAIHDYMVSRKGAWQQTVQGIRNALETNLFVMTNTTMLQENSKELAATLDFLADLGVPTIGLNALIYAGHGVNVGTGLPPSDLHELLPVAKEKTALHHQRLIWYTPTQYCHFDPTQYQLGVKGCTAALYNMCIEPNGDVIPCQSYYQALGNFLTSSWENIWHHELAVSIRERKYVPEDCLSCAILSECGGGCPLSLKIENPQLIPIDNIPVLDINSGEV